MRRRYVKVLLGDIPISLQPHGCHVTGGQAKEAGQGPFHSLLDPIIQRDCSECFVGGFDVEGVIDEEDQLG